MIDKTYALIIEKLSKAEEFVYEKSTKKARQHYYDSIEEKGGAVVEAIYKLLINWYYDGNPPKPKRVRRTHDLFCVCRNCSPSIKTYHRRMTR